MGFWDILLIGSHTSINYGEKIGQNVNGQQFLIICGILIWLFHWQPSAGGWCLGPWLLVINCGLGGLLEGDALAAAFRRKLCCIFYVAVSKLLLLQESCACGFFDTCKIRISRVRNLTLGEKYYVTHWLIYCCRCLDSVTLNKCGLLEMKGYFRRWSILLSLILLNSHCCIIMESIVKKKKTNF